MILHAVYKPRAFLLRSLFALGCLVALCGSQAFASVNIMPLGDSITQGGHTQGSSAYASYRYALYFKLVNAGDDVNFVGSLSAVYNGTPDPALYPNYSTTFDRDHEGHWGKTSAYLNTNLNTWLAGLPTGQKPDIVVLNIGTNDATSGVTATTFTNNINSIIAKLRAANANVTVVLSNLMVIPSYQAAFDSLNSAIVSIVAAQNTSTSRVVLADIATNLPANSRYDGIHPNAVGEEYLATVYYNAIQPFISASTSAVTVDNAQTADVSVIGNWAVSTVAPGYYGTNYIHDNNTDKGNRAVMFLPELPADGDYLVYNHGIADPNRATNVPFDIVTSTGTSTLTVNEQLNGTSWSLLGLYTFTAATAEVTIRNTGTNGYVLADAVRFIPGSGITVDNADAAVTVVGSWSISTVTPGYLGANYAHDGNTGKGTKTFSFKPAVSSTGSYLVFARWPADPNRATNVPIDIVTSTGAVTTVTVNEQLNNNTWTLLGTYTLASTNAAVTVRTTGTNGYVVADGVRVIPAPVQ